MTRGPGRRLITLADLTERHHGRMVDVGGIVGTLVGIVPLGGRVQLALVVGGRRCWSDWLAADSSVDVWRAATPWPPTTWR